MSNESQAATEDRHASASKALGKLSTRRVVLFALVVALVLAGVLSSLASGSPDSFEFSVFEQGGVAEPDGEVWSASPLPDYSAGEVGSVGFLDLSTALSGVLGTLATLALGWLVIKLINAGKRSSARKEPAA